MSEWMKLSDETSVHFWTDPEDGEQFAFFTQYAPSGRVVDDFGMTANDLLKAAALLREPV